MSLRPRWLVAATAGLALVLVACGRSDSRSQFVVFAAASMTETMGRMVADFERHHPELKVQLHCAGTPQLLMQLREGANADVFVAADELSMAVIERELGVAAPPRIFAKNSLVIAVAKGNPERIASLTDLARDGLFVALCGPDVPAGRYAREVLGKANVAVRSVSDEPSCNALLAKVHLGEIDAGMLYVTDVRDTSKSVDAVAIPAAHNVEVSYPVAVLAATRARGAADLFVDHLFSVEARTVLESVGFRMP